MSCNKIVQLKRSDTIEQIAHGNILVMVMGEVIEGGEEISRG